MGEDTLRNRFTERYETWGRRRVRSREGEIWRRELGVGEEERMRERERKKEDPSTHEGCQPHWRPTVYHGKAWSTCTESHISSSLFEEDYTLVFLPFALSRLFSALSLSSFFMRSSKVGALEVPDLEPSSMTTGLSSSSNYCGGTSPSSPAFDIFSPSD
jgi:hypothetical protein